MAADTSEMSKASQPQGSRLAFVDALRGFTVISMVLFHYCYDLRYLAGLPLGFFQPPYQDIWRATISWTFLFIAGWMCSYSRSFLRRAGKYLLVALVIFAVTTVAAVDTPINFGVIFCMGASTLVGGLLKKLNVLRGSTWLTVLFAILFILCLPIPQGHFGIGSLSVAVPRTLYQNPYLSWLGFPGPSFSSGDYYPLLPFCLMYLVGENFGIWLRKSGVPQWMWTRGAGPLRIVGRHSLLVYIVHQPILLLLSGVAL